MATTTQEQWLLVGTYTHPGTSDGVYVYSHDGGGTFRRHSSARVDNPSYIAAAPDRRHIYAVTERDAPSYVNALRFDPQEGSLESLNRTESPRAGMCNIVVSPEGRYVLTADYSSGGVSVFAVNPDGSVGPEVQTLSYHGSGPNAARQEASHIHCVRYCPCGRHIFVTDLGGDAIYRYDVDPASGEYVDTGSLKVFKMEPGSGPRHFVFDPEGRHMYLANELTASVTVFSYEKGEIAPVQNISATRTGNGDGGDIKLSPDGRYVYMSVRENGDDGVAIYRRDGGTRILEPVGYQPCVEHPRNIEFTPDGRFLLVCGMKADRVQVFRAAGDGSLSDTGSGFEVSMPTCLLFIGG